MTNFVKTRRNLEQHNFFYNSIVLHFHQGSLFDPGTFCIKLIRLNTINSFDGVHSEVIIIFYSVHSSIAMLRACVHHYKIPFQRAKIQFRYKNKITFVLSAHFYLNICQFMRIISFKWQNIVLYQIFILSQSNRSCLRCETNVIKLSGE